MKTIVTTEDELENMISDLLDEKLAPIKEDLFRLRGETVFSIQQVADKLGRSRATIYNYCQMGRIVAVRRGHSYTIAQSALEEYINGKNKKK